MEVDSIKVAIVSPNVTEIKNDQKQKNYSTEISESLKKNDDMDVNSITTDNTVD